MTDSSRDSGSDRVLTGTPGQEDIMGTEYAVVCRVVRHVEADTPGDAIRKATEDLAMMDNTSHLEVLSLGPAGHEDTIGLAHQALQGNPDATAELGKAIAAQMEDKLSLWLARLAGQAAAPPRRPEPVTRPGIDVDRDVLLEEGGPAVTVDRPHRVYAYQDDGVVLSLRSGMVRVRQKYTATPELSMDSREENLNGSLTLNGGERVVITIGPREDDNLHVNVRMTGGRHA
jgi:hypothetical protein